MSAEREEDPNGTPYLGTDPSNPAARGPFDVPISEARRLLATAEVMSAEREEDPGCGGQEWAARALAAGRPIRSKAWFRGSVHPHDSARDPSLGGYCFFRSEDPQVPPPEQDAMIGRWEVYLAKHPEELWEYADLPRRATFGVAALVDLAFFPDAFPIVTVRHLLERCFAHGGDFGDMLEVAWTHAGHNMIGKGLREFVQHDQMRVSIQMARMGSPEARRAVLDAVTKLRDGK